MEQTALQNKKGVSLIEVLIALVLLAIVSLAILQSSLLAYRQTSTNLLRDEALRISEGVVNGMRALPFTKELVDPQLTAVGVQAPTTELRNMRGYQVTYAVQRTISDLGADAKQIDVSVSWLYSGKTFTHAVTSIIGRQ